MNHEVVPLSVYEADKRKPEASQLLSYAEMASMPAPEWLIEGVLQSGSTAVMFGRSNSFKSFLAIDLGLCVASGRAWHGRSVIKGDVLFVATEGASGVGRLRIPAWYDHHRIAVEQRRAFLYPREVRIDVADEVSAIVNAMNNTGEFRLMVLDIFGGTMSGSEVEDKTARAWVHGVQRIVRETSAAVLTVAHTGWQDESRARMHTHFWGSFDTRLKVEGNKEALTTILTVDRHKDADSNGSWGFQLISHENSLVPELTPDVATSKARRLSPRLQGALTALDDAIVADGTTRAEPSFPANVKVVSIEKWREHFYRHSDGDSPDAKRQAFKRSRDQLKQKGLVAFSDDHVWRCFDDEDAQQILRKRNVSRSAAQQPP